MWWKQVKFTLTFILTYFQDYWKSFLHASLSKLYTWTKMISSSFIYLTSNLALCDNEQWWHNTLLISRHFSASLNLTHYITQNKLIKKDKKICCIILQMGLTQINLGKLFICNIIMHAQFIKAKLNHLFDMFLCIRHLFSDSGFFAKFA